MKIKDAVLFITLLLSCSTYDRESDSNYSAAKELYRQSVTAGSNDEKHKLRIEIIRLSPRSEYGLFARAWLLYNDGKHEEAVKTCTEAISLNPGEPLFYHNRAVSLVILFKRNGNRTLLDNALTDLDRSIALDRSYSGSYSARAEVKLLLKEYNAAIADYSEAIKLKENDPQLWYSRGLARLRGLNDSRGAESDASRAVQIDPQFAAAWCLRGVARLNLGNKRGACSDYRKAGSLDPGSCLFGGEGGIIPGCND